ncbi:MAG: copper homeostasis protein CutC [Bacteroidetes bacterium]|nr:copper homeostasis protein CutC [Bacteroidota bacterium]
MDNQLEICSFNIQSALIAQEAGAQRVELCADPEGGGTTPSYGLIKRARELLHIQLYPIIRPRAGDFLFNDEEFEIMQTDVANCKNLGCDGVVIGMLQSDGCIDKKRCAQLVQLAYPLGVTFHRAFDHAAHSFEALEDIISIGCERILSSGQKPTAIEGADLLNELIRQAEDRIVIMPGSGVRANNVVELKEKTGAMEFHTSARTTIKSPMQFINESMKEEGAMTMVDEKEVWEIVQLLNNG